MVVSVCPVDIVAAPVDGVWELLTQTSTLPSPLDGGAGPSNTLERGRSTEA